MKDDIYNKNNNEFGTHENQDEIDDFFKQFDKISDNLNKNDDSRGDDDQNTSDELIRGILSSQGQSNRSARHSTKKKASNSSFSLMMENCMNKIFDFGNSIIALIKGKFLISTDSHNKQVESYSADTVMIDSPTDERNEGNEMTTTQGSSPSTTKSKTNRKKKKKYRLNFKQLFKFIVCICLFFFVIVSGFAISVIVTAPKIDPDNIYTLLSESSVLYDDQGNIIDSIFVSEGNRTNVAYEDLPPDLVNAFIAIEDKTFKEHNGFNFIRILGAIKESVLSGEDISGTSTITQQLARNLYLTDSRTKHSIKRKIAEAYYTVLLEKALTKEQIIEAYLNTIGLGFDSYGVQSASQAYFSKDVNDLDLLECAALASMPKAPSSYALIKRLESETADPDDENIIFRGNDYTYVYNEISKPRRDLTLKFMCEQGLITEEQKETALADDLKAHINPSLDSMTEISSYFADYAIKDVINDLMDEYGYEYQEARDKIYKNGYRIYTTMNSKAQKIAEAEFSNNANFPTVAKIKKDDAGNVLGKNKKVLLYNYHNYFSEDGTFTLQPEEFKYKDNGDLILFKGHRLNFYKTEVQGKIDYSVEFNDMYIEEDKTFYSIDGGVITIPQEYKTKDEDGNLIISSDFFKKKSDPEKPDAFVFNNGVIDINSVHYVLKQKVVQPQSAIVITDYHTGGIKAMVGGRNTVGRLLYNRAINTRQPGSSIKPLAVYGAALQKSVDAVNSDQTETFVTNDNSGNQVPNLYGEHFTAASVIDDAPMRVNGKIWPKNWYSGYRGLHTLRTAVEQSVNVCAVKVFQQVGVEYSTKFLKNLGITSIVQSGDTNDMNAAALALGGMSEGISPLEIASGYGTYANGGTYVTPVSYTKVTNKLGEVILDKNIYTSEVVDPGVSFIMTDILQSVVTNGLGKRAAIGSQPVGGKTGTTTDNYDAWFVGVTPQYATSVWIGNDVNIELSQGSASAASLWSKIMKQVCAGIPTGSFPSKPENVISVTIDNRSGLLPSELSSLDDRGTVRSEYFVKGTEPTKVDNVHKYVTICPESGLLATPYCYSHSSKFGVMRPYMVDPSVGDIAYEVPHYYCNIHNLDPDVYAPPPGTDVNNQYQWDGIFRDDKWLNQQKPTENSTGSGLGSEGNGANESNSNNNGTPAEDEDVEQEMPDWLKPR